MRRPAALVVVVGFVVAACESASPGGDGPSVATSVEPPVSAAEPPSTTAVASTTRTVDDIGASTSISTEPAPTTLSPTTTDASPATDLTGSSQELYSTPARTSSNSTIASGFSTPT